MSQVSDRVADAGAVTAGAVASVSWVVTINEYLQLVATAVAIVAGAAAAWYHIQRTKRLPPKQ